MGRPSADASEASEESTVSVSVRLPQSLIEQLDAWGKKQWRLRWGDAGGPRLTRTAVIQFILAEKLLAESPASGPAKTRPRRKKTSRAA